MSLEIEANISSQPIQKVRINKVAQVAGTVALFLWCPVIDDVLPIIIPIIAETAPSTGEKPVVQDAVLFDARSSRKREELTNTLIEN